MFKFLLGALSLALGLQSAFSSYLGVSYKHKKSAIVFKCLGGDSSVEKNIKNLKKWCPEFKPQLIEGRLTRDLKLSSSAKILREGDSIVIEDDFEILHDYRAPRSNHFVTIFKVNNAPLVNLNFFNKLNANVARGLRGKGVKAKSRTGYQRLGDGKPANAVFDATRDLYDRELALFLAFTIVGLPVATAGTVAFDIVTLPIGVAGEIANAVKRNKDKKNLQHEQLYSIGRDFTYDSEHIKVKMKGLRNLSYNQKVEKTISDLPVPGVNSFLKTKLTQIAFDEMKEQLIQ